MTSFLRLTSMLGYTTFFSYTEVNAQGEREFAVRTREFLRRIRAYNNAVSFTSLGAKIDDTITNNAHNVYTMRVHSEVWHRVGSLLPEEGQRPQYAQVWMYDGDDLLNAQQENICDLDREFLQLLNQLLLWHNPYARLFKNAAQRMMVDENARVHLRMLDPTTHDPRRYNRPTVEEIGGIIIGDEMGGDQLNPTRDIIIERLQHAGGHRYQRISELNPSYFPLRYPFMFLYGEQGWHTSIPLANVDLARNPELMAYRQANLAPDVQVDEENEAENEDVRRGVAGSLRVSQAQFYNYHLQRRQEFSPLQWAGRLLQEMIIDAWVCVESNRLQFQRSNQVKLRADLYSGLQDAMAGGVEDNVEQLGRQIILASSFIGGPRHMRQ